MQVQIRRLPQTQGEATKGLNDTVGGNTCAVIPPKLNASTAGVTVKYFIYNFLFLLAFLSLQRMQNKAALCLFIKTLILIFYFLLLCSLSFRPIRLSFVQESSHRGRGRRNVSGKYFMVKYT